jgi:transglutaminase-like putative cysteine protease
MLMIVVASLAVGLNYGTLIGRDAGVALLILMLSLKLLELKVQRDVMVFVFLGYFLVVTNFLFSQSLLMAVYMFITCIGLTTTLVMLSRHDTELNLKANAKVATTLILQAVPLMLVLFVLFPRLPGPLWMMPSDKTQARTGLSNSMSPGSISQLIESNEVAFRVKFDGTPPPSSSLYWRGPVLSRYDGKTWHVRPSWDEKPREPIEFHGGETRYTMTLLPHDNTWLLALDMPAEYPEYSHLTDEYSLQVKKPIKDVRQYTLVSYTSYQTAATDPRQLASYLRLPRTLNPQTRDWAEQISQRFDQPRERIQQVLMQFREQPFSYTLNPALLGENAMDDFLFRTREGFCEHYAGSFVYLMRLMNIPARVVLGYQGGENSSIADYMIVRQSDAHAWAEVWLADEGWVRVDPTSAVSPERVETGIEAAFPETDLAGGFARSRNPLLKNLVLYWDNINYNWHRWVLGYDASTQRNLLERLGLDATNWKHVAIGIGITVGSLILFISVWLTQRNRQKPKDSVSRWYEVFCQRLSRAGFNRKAHEGSKDFAARVSRSRDDLASDVELITRFYQQLRYGRNPPAKLYSQFQQRVRQFRPKRSA